MSALASQCAQNCSDEINFADSGEMCSDIAILGLVLALVLAQLRQDNMPEHLIRSSFPLLPTDMLPSHDFNIS